MKKRFSSAALLCMALLCLISGCGRAKVSRSGLALPKRRSVCRIISEMR